VAIRSFSTAGTEDLFHGRDSKASRATCPKDVWSVAYRKLDYLNAAAALGDLRRPPGNRLEQLKGDRKGQHSIRINDQFRICFYWTPEGPHDVEITDYH